MVLGNRTPTPNLASWDTIRCTSTTRLLCEPDLHRVDRVLCVPRVGTVPFERAIRRHVTLDLGEVEDFSLVGNYEHLSNVDHRVPYRIRTRLTRVAT